MHTVTVLLYHYDYGVSKLPKNLSIVFFCLLMTPGIPGLDLTFNFVLEGFML